MKALILTDAQLENILLKDSERFELINAGEWKQDCKAQLCTFTFKDTTTGLIYEGFAGRIGSPFTEWTYDSEVCEDAYVLKPVEEIEVIVIKTKEVDDSKITETETVEEM
ncbi:MAG TPA: hypothetical protein GXZ90_09110 [Clostridiales bacterium]|nr:hypothetical protein [Clostridiales bacterium]